MKKRRILSFAAALIFIITLPLSGVRAADIPRSTEGKTVVPGGQCIGIALYMDGIMIVGSQEIRGENGQTAYPARDAGLEPGDIIKSVNGTRVSNITEFVLQSDRAGEAIRLDVEREGQMRQTTVRPAYDSSDGKYRLGLWLKDSTAGIGTLTFYDPANSGFAALGHAVCESETGVIMPLARGEVVNCTINEIIKGQRGKPGELRGGFRADAITLGKICTNTQYGIYGTMLKEPQNPKYKTIQLGSREDVHTGEAKILTTIESEVQEYSIKIVKVNRQTEKAQKGMVLQITDPVLLQKTGGIVQGMSGSPIIQDGKLIGAVTHVMVNEPTKGYGLYADWMIDAA